MKYKTGPTQGGSQQYGKRVFAYALVALAFFVLVIFVLEPPPLTSCDKNPTQPCGCPTDSAFIEKKNVVLIDATDPMYGKISDVKELINGLVAHKSGLIEWIKSGKRVSQTSIFILNRTLPAEMTPVGRYCQLPPTIALMTAMSSTDEEALKSAINEKIAGAANSIPDLNSAPESQIVKALATTTNSATYWTPGSNLILVSDLYENSATCGFFETAPIPSFSRINDHCTSWVERLKGNIASAKSNVSICTIFTKNPKEGLVRFWNDLFLYSAGRSPLYSCSPAEILSRGQ